MPVLPWVETGGRRRLAADEVERKCRLANGAERIEIYSLAGRLRRIEEPDGSWLTFRYDGEGHLTEVRHHSGESAHYGIERQGRKLRAVLGRSETIVELGEDGLPAALIQRMDGHEWRVESQYGDRGQLTGILYPQTAGWLTYRAERAGGRVVVRIGLPGLPLAEASFDAGTQSTEIRCSNGARMGEVLERGAPARLRRVWHRGPQESALDFEYEYDGHGRIVQAGSERFGYDGEGRLAAWGSTSYSFDEQGRLASVGNQSLLYGESPAVLGIHGRCTFSFDPLGRRLCKRDGAGETRYFYNLYGQLEEVRLPNGESVRYHYDGFGRLVARETAEEIRYYICGFDGLRLAEAVADGSVIRRYIWMAKSCIAMLDPAGELTSLHRIHGGRLAAVCEPSGKFRSLGWGDPYGYGAHLEDGVPGFASLFGDPQTGLWLAGSRWLDPQIAQFLTPDTWFGTSAWDHLPRGMRHVLEQLPGGADFSARPLSAYAWCDFDPVNRSDPNGHNPLGLFWSILSAFFWQMQVTSVALQMEVINIVVNILLLPFSFLYWDFYKKISIFNAIPPLVASYRLMVPFAFPLNGIYTAGNGVFTMGAVIWARGDQLRNLEETSQRDVLICDNASMYLAATDVAASDSFRVRHPNARATAVVNATGTGLNGVTMDASAGAAVQDAFAFQDWVAIRIPGGEDEFRQVGAAGVGTLTFFAGSASLPAAMQGQNVEVRRLDAAIVRIKKNAQSICRSLTFVRGVALHYATQIPEEFPAEGLDVSEYLPAVKRDLSNAAFQSESVVVQLAQAGDRADYNANDFVRIRSGSNYFARQVVRTQGEANLVLDVPLPPLTPPAAYDPVEIVKMAAGATANDQSASGDRIEVGGLTELRKLDGLAITAGGSTERRIVTALFVRCPVAALPNALQGVALTVETVVPGAAANGSVDSSKTIKVQSGQASRVSKDRPVRVRTGGTDFFTTVASVSDDRIDLTEEMPAAFAKGTAVTVTDLANAKSADGDPSPPPGDSVVFAVEDPSKPASGDLLFVRQRGSNAGGVVRQISAPPTVVAKADGPPSSFANLTVQRFSPVLETSHGDAKAKPVVLRVTVSGPTNPFVVHDELHLVGGEEAYGKVFAVNAMDLILEDPVAAPVLSASGFLERIAPTGHSTANAKLDESLIMIPAAMDEDLVNRRRAVELHEMRHVWQYAVLGPFFFSQPLPWLFHLGFAADSEGAGHAAHNLTKWISLGLVDKLFAVIAWGIGKAAGGMQDASGNGILNGKVITLDAGIADASLNAFSEGSPVEVTPAGGSTLFNIVDGLDKAARQVRLRFTLEGVSDGARVTAAVSAFDKVDRVVNKYFSLNLERLWSDYIPTAWGRALSGLLNRENWFPLLGFYPLSLAAAGFDQSRVSFEQDASFQSGDIYNPFTISQPNEVYVGQFSRVYAFVYGRGAGDTGAGLSKLGNIVESLTVEPPVISGKAPTDLVRGSVLSQTNPARVRFRETWMIPMKAKAANVLGAFFVAAAPGEYVLHTPGELDRIQRMLFFSADFFDLRKIQVKPLEVTPALSAANPAFETEEVHFTIQGDPAAAYSLRYKGTPPANPATINGLTFRAPVLTGASAEAHQLEIVAAYEASASIFQGPGQEGAAPLTGAQRANVCQELSFDVAPIVAPTIGPVAAGASTTFQMPIPPLGTPTVTSPLPAGATVNATVTNGSGRPATLTFHAPDHVNAPADIIFEMVFGSGPSKKVTATVRVNPSS